MAGAAGGFLTRSFELMLKDCGGKKYAPLQKAIQDFLGSCLFSFRSILA